MLDLFQIAAADNCQGLGALIVMVKKVFTIIQFAIPIALILLGTMDLGKAVISSDEKEIKAAQSRLIKRCIYAALIFFVVLIVNLLMTIVSSGVESDKNTKGTDTTSWLKCWNQS